MTTCANCGAGLGPDDHFCQACGQPVEAAPATCPKCGRPTEPGSEFCLWCGAYVGPPRAPVLDVGAGPAKPAGAGTAGWELATIALLAVALVVCVVSIVSTFREIALLVSVRTGGFITEATARSNDDRQRAIAQLLLVVFVITGLLWLIWQFRAHNVLRRRSPSVRFTPALGVTWWFVPVANLVMPFKAMRELWVGRPENEMTSDEKRAPAVRWWWATYLLTTMFSIAALIAGALATEALRSVPVSRAAFFNDAIVRDFLFILSRVAEIAAGVLAIRMLMGAQGKLRPAGVVGRPGLEPGPPD